jgi:hypothetical protein
MTAPRQYFPPLNPSHTSVSSVPLVRPFTQTLQVDSLSIMIDI